MHDDIQWLIGLLATAFFAFSGMLFATFRNLSNKWSEGNKAIYNKIDEADKIHAVKIDDIKDRYVRRDDLNEHIGRLDKAIQAVRDEQREQTRQVLEAIATSRS